jgi:hypothetical protein
MYILESYYQNSEGIVKFILNSEMNIEVNFIIFWLLA